MSKPAKSPKRARDEPRLNPLEQAFTKVAKAFVKKGGTKFLLKFFPYIATGYFGNKLGYAYRNSPAPDFFNKLVQSLGNLGMAFNTLLPSFNPFDLLWGIITGLGMFVIVWYRKKNAKKYRIGSEYGSARWGTERI